MSSPSGQSPPDPRIPEVESGSSSEPSSSPATAEPPGPTPDRPLPGAEATGPPSAAAEPALRLGQAVRLRHGIPYLRSAEPMPMLRPPDLVDREEVGQVQELRSLGRVAVRFRRGSFLIDTADLVAVSEN
ncbi:MAG: NAD(P)H dehydrogenase assembly family protein [Synechococcaceae cyanobacterium]|jgi:hypothetical protein